MQQGDSIRCFVAIELPVEVTRSLDKTSASLRRAVRAPVKWVDPDAIHLTLKFLGNVQTSRLDGVRKAMARACSETGPLRLQVTTLGAFPSMRRPRIVWVGLEGDLESLERLARRVDEEMGLLGFGRETRPFAPHLTLGRVRDEATAAQRESIGAILEHTRPPDCDAFRVVKACLMRSHLSPQGARYTCLERAAFPGPRPAD